MSSRRETELDEEATARRFADTGRWRPVYRPVQVRWLDVAFIVDADPSMVLWQQQVDDLRAELVRLGAFRDVRRWYLHYHQNRLRLASHSLHEPGEVIDPTGRRLYLVVSAAIGQAWDSGAITALLERYGRAGPTAILQPLPQRLWDRTAIRPRLGRASGQPAAANRTLRYVPRSEHDELAGRAVPVPVLELDPAWLRNWAQLVATGAITDVAISTVTTTAPNVDEPITPAVRLTRAQQQASPEAYQLMRHLSVVPINIPIMRLVQHVTSDNPDPAHLAEVYLSGLLEQLDTDAAMPVFDFIPGVRDVLLGTLRRTEALRVLDVVIDLLDTKSRNDQEFVAYLRPNPSGRPERLAVEPFASVARHVLNAVARHEPDRRP